jgi:hypothetical protein
MALVASGNFQRRVHLWLVTGSHGTVMSHVPNHALDFRTLCLLQTIPATVSAARRIPGLARDY